MENKVTYGKPKKGGAISIAPLGTALPTDATSPLDPAFKSLGYCSDDGLGHDPKTESKDVKAWGGDTVMAIQTSKDDTFKFTLLEALNVEVLKLFYGPKNVTGDLDTGITIKSNSDPQRPYSLVIDTILIGGILKRIVIPNGLVKETGGIQYKDDDAISYETTMAALPDKEENTHYEYIIKPKEA